MSTAQPGNTLHIHYKGTLDDGTVFDSSEGRDPLAFELGSGQIIPGLDAGVTGMALGETRSVRVEPEEAYGTHDPAKVQGVDRAGIPADIPADPGTQLQMQTQDGQMLNVTVVEVTETEVILDANHPLAGKALTFNVELVAVA